MTSAGNFTNLTTFGADIVNNPIYGLSVGTVKSKYLVLGSCGTSTVGTGLSQITNGSINSFVYPNPNNGTFALKINRKIESGEFVIINGLGEKIHSQKISNEENNITAKDIPSGLYYYIILENKRRVGNGKMLVE